MTLSRFFPGAMVLLGIFIAVKMSASDWHAPSKNNFIKVESQAFANTLYYSGTIQPIKTSVITCPADGVVLNMPFEYGTKLEQGQLMFLLSSAKFLADYKTALMQYVKAKSDFNTSQTQMHEADFLHKNLLISDDDFNSKKSNFYASQLALLQAKDLLENLIQQLDVKDISLYNLTIADIDKITEAMHLQKNSESLRIMSPLSGVALSATKNEEEAKKLVKGDAVKQGEVLAIIGDMSGISVKIKVNELTVNQLHEGQKVTVSGIAFPNDVLQGQIQRVDRQGEVASGGLPVFPVEIVVPKLTEEQQKYIHVGMSAKVEINLAEPEKIMVPVASIIDKNGGSYVMMMDKNGKRHETLVVTGKTTMDSVVILSGLKAGDTIVTPG